MTKEDAGKRTWRLMSILADGRFHSGQLLAVQLGLSRASVFNAMVAAEDYGVAIQRVRGRGYRLARSWDPLQYDEVTRWLGENAAQFNLEILPQATSSNTLLLERAAMGVPSGTVLAVELQTEGRGRLGRTWHTELGSALTFSLLWRFDRGLNALSGLSLAVGIAIVRALGRLGIQGVQLKWPNDILTGQGKLGGVLVEGSGDVFGPSATVIGIGVNYRLPDSIAQRIGQPASALDEICSILPSRSKILAVMLQELAAVLQHFVAEGFTALRSEWEQYHAYQNCEIKMQMPDGSTVSGYARGVSDRGELCLETAQGMRYLNSGEVGHRK